MNNENIELLNEGLKKNLVELNDGEDTLDKVETLSKIITDHDKVIADVEKERIRADSALAVEHVRQRGEFKGRMISNGIHAGLMLGVCILEFAGHPITFKSHSICRALKP